MGIHKLWWTRDINLERGRVLGTDDSTLKILERLQHEITRLVLWMFERDSYKLGETFEEDTPIVGQSAHVAGLALEHFTIFRCVDWGDDDKVLAILADLLECGHGMVSMHLVNFLVDQNALKHFGIRNWLDTSP